MHCCHGRRHDVTCSRESVNTRVVITFSVSERICKFCYLNTIEDEVHFLCNCSAYHNERQLFFKYIVDSAPSFRTLDDLAKLIWLMTCEDDIVINALADFVYKCFEMRKCAIT